MEKKIGCYSCSFKLLMSNSWKKEEKKCRIFSRIKELFLERNVNSYTHMSRRYKNTFLLVGFKRVRIVLCMYDGWFFLNIGWECKGRVFYFHNYWVGYDSWAVFVENRMLLYHCWVINALTNKITHTIQRNRKWMKN